VPRPPKRREQQGAPAPKPEAVEGTTPDLEKRDSVFQPEFLEDLRYWIETDRKIALRLMNIIEAVMCDPFTGIGKPEPLKYVAPGAWSRRLTQEHRVVYLVRADRIDFLQARYHY
jgi:toxin YoeB